MQQLTNLVSNDKLFGLPTLYTEDECFICNDNLNKYALPFDDSADTWPGHSVEPLMTVLETMTTYSWPDFTVFQTSDGSCLVFPVVS